MDKVELYRQVYSAFKRMCTEGKQPSSFRAYCKKHGVEQNQMPFVLKEEFQPVTTLPGYVRDRGKRIVCSRIFEDFKKLCSEGRQPGIFKSYCENFGISRSQMHDHLKRNKLTVIGLPGYSGPKGENTRAVRKYPSKTLSSRRQAFFPAMTRM